MYEEGSRNFSERKIEALAHVHSNHLKNPFVHYQFNDEYPDEANHASSGVPNLGSCRESKKWSLELGLYFRHFHPRGKLGSLDPQREGLSGGSEGLVGTVEDEELAMVAASMEALRSSGRGNKRRG